MPLEWIIFQIFINTVEVGVLFYLLCNKFAAKGNKTFIPTLSFIIVSIGVLSLRIFISAVDALPTTEIFLPVVCIVYLSLFREGKILNKLFWSFIAILLLATISVLTIVIIALVSQLSADDIMTTQQQSIERFLTMTIAKILQVAIFYILVRKTRSSVTKNYLSILPTIICFSIPSISFILSFFIYILLLNDSYVSYELTIAVVSSLLIINIIMFVLYEIIGKEAEKNYVLIAKNKQYELIEQHNRQIVNMYDKMREWRHDYSHHMQLILEMLKNSSEGNNSDAINYIKELDIKIESSSLETITGNTVVDAIVSAKMTLASAHNITLEHNISLAAELNIDNTDLCSILSNLLDNAIEACCKLSENRYISIEMLIFRNQFNIKVINSTNGEYKIENGKLKTTKSGDLHGIGMGHVKSIVESYGGIFDVKPEASSFMTHISIPLLK